MKNAAMVLERFGQPLVRREMDIPPLEEGQVLVRMEAAGVCGSDVHMHSGEDERTPLPIVLGHEGVGRIADIRGAHPDIDGRPLEVGERIIWNRGVVCGRCYYCRIALEPWLCTDRSIYGINRPLGQAPGLNGCYSQYIILDARTDVIPLGESADPVAMVSASCAGATVAHAFDEYCPKAGDAVLVQGPGPLGVYAIAFAKALGASQIIVIGGSAGRMDLCRDFGATLLLNRNDTTAEQRFQAVMDATAGRGVDVAVEAAGAASAPDEGLALVRPGGIYLSTGFSQPGGLVSVDFFRQVVRKNLRIQGVWVSDARHVRHAVKLVERQPELFARMITHRFGLDQADDALEAMRSKAALKAVLQLG